jgi:hypothetical protein
MKVTETEAPIGITNSLIPRTSNILNKTQEQNFLTILEACPLSLFLVTVSNRKRTLIFATNNVI